MSRTTAGRPFFVVWARLFQRLFCHFGVRLRPLRSAFGAQQQAVNCRPSIRNATAVTSYTMFYRRVQLRPRFLAGADNTSRSLCVISAPSVSGNNFLHAITFCAYEANAAAFKVTRLVGSKLLQATKQDAPALACDLLVMCRCFV